MLIPVLVDGLSDAALTFLVAVGLSLVFSVLRIVNVAHGSFFSLGSYTAITLGAALGVYGFNPVLCYATLLLSAMFISTALGPLTERLFLRRTYGRSESVQILMTFGIFLILEDLQKLIFGAQPRQNDTPLSLLGMWTLDGIAYPVYQIALIGLAVSVAICLHWFLRHTRLGRIVLAVVSNWEMAECAGVNSTRVFNASFTFGVFLAALGGSLASPITGAALGLGAEATIVAFAVAAIGGLGRIEGAALAALIVGIGRALAVYYAPDLDRATPYLVMFAVLLIRPQGLLGLVEARKI